jgi:uncharacterized protein (DUF488 family)
MKLFTIGFTKTSAESFFTRLTQAGATRLVDVRLNNTSQLSGFAKKDDLKYFLRVIAAIPYEHRLDLAPTQELLASYRGRSVPWAAYEEGFLGLMQTRGIDRALRADDLDGSCLLCSEEKPARCHRRLVAEYLAAAWGSVEIIHL